MGRPKPPDLAISTPANTDVAAMPSPGVRSMPPVAITNDSPSACTPVTTEASSSDETLLQSANAGFMMVKKTDRRIRTATTRICWRIALYCSGMPLDRTVVGAAVAVDISWPRSWSRWS